MFTAPFIKKEEALNHKNIEIEECLSEIEYESSANGDNKTLV
jgi:hypothetical protein